MRYYYNPKTNQLVKYDSVKTDNHNMTHYEIEGVKQPAISWDLFISQFKLVEINGGMPEKKNWSEFLSEFKEILK